jgi:hypothetical protein
VDIDELVVVVVDVDELVVVVVDVDELVDVLVVHSATFMINASA